MGNLWKREREEERMKNLTLDMYDYNVWANQEMINHLKGLPKEVYHHDVQSGFSSIAEVFSHIYLVEQTWFDIFEGLSMEEAMAKAFQLKEQMEAKNIGELEVLYDDLSRKYKLYLANQENVDEVMVVNNPYAGELKTSISETILHVVTHGNYHRGNIATMLRQQGHASVMQDYGLYLYMR